jgi:hypothetical protein
LLKASIHSSSLFLKNLYTNHIARPTTVTLTASIPTVIRSAEPTLSKSGIIIAPTSMLLHLFQSKHFTINFNLSFTFNRYKTIMSYTISELEAERTKILEEIESKAKNMSKQNSTEEISHTLSDWLAAAEEVMPEKTGPIRGNPPINDRSKTNQQTKSDQAYPENTRFKSDLFNSINLQLAKADRKTNFFALMILL